MTLLSTIKTQLDQVSHYETVKAMGYHNLERGDQTLQKFLATDDIYLWLKNGSFDLRFTSKTFLIELCNVLHIPAADVEPEIEQSLHHLHLIITMEQPSIFIDTKFRKSSQSIFASAAMGVGRRIYLDKELFVYKSDVEIFKIIKNMITQHYHKHNGKVTFWRGKGNISHYVYHHIDGSRHIFNPDGSIFREPSDIFTKIGYSFNFSHRCGRNATVNTMIFLSHQFKRDFEHITNLAKACTSIDEVIDILEENFSLHNFKLSNYHHFFITVSINDEKFMLSPELRILTKNELDRVFFEPTVKYDIEDIREGTIQPLECRLLGCNSVEEQVKVIEKYLKRANQRYKKWRIKPTKLYLYHSYEESPKEFEIKMIEGVVT